VNFIVGPEPIGKADPLPNIQPPKEPPLASPRRDAWMELITGTRLVHAAKVANGKAQRRTKKLERETARATRAAMKAERAVRRTGFDLLVSKFKLATLR
jgi:hypothetical protein